MARGNQKNGETAIRFRTVLWTIAACAVVAMVGLGLAHQHNLHHDLADEGRKLDREIESMDDRIRQAIKVEAALKSPLALEQRVRDLNLGLVPIQATQRLYLARTAPPSSAPALPLPRLVPATEVAAAATPAVTPSPVVRSPAKPTVTTSKPVPAARNTPAGNAPNLVASARR